MIKFDLEVEPVWVTGAHPAFDETEIGDYPKTQRQGVSVLIAPLFPGMVRELLDKHTDIIVIENQKYNDLTKEISEVADSEGKTKRLLELITTQALPTREKVNQIAYNSDIIDLVVKDWGGFHSSKDTIINCTRENKISLFVIGGYVVMGTAIINLAIELAKKGELVSALSKEELEKNLKTSQDGQQRENGK